MEMLSLRGAFGLEIRAAPCGKMKQCHNGPTVSSPGARVSQSLKYFWIGEGVIEGYNIAVYVYHEDKIQASSDSTQKYKTKKIVPAAQVLQSGSYLVIIFWPFLLTVFNKDSHWQQLSKWSILWLATSEVSNVGE